MPAPKAVFFDLDDTLSESYHPISTEIATRIASLSQKMPVALVTGTSWRRVEREFLAPLPQKTNMRNVYIFPSNASQGLAWNGKTWETLYSFELSEEERTKISSAIARALEETQVVAGEESRGERIEQRASGLAFAARGRDASAEEKSAWDPDRSKREKLVAALVPLLPEFGIYIGGRATIDITKKGVDKTVAVKWMCEHLHLKPEELLYVGDSFGPGGNDEVVISTGIQTLETSGPTETSRIIDEILSS